MPIDCEKFRIELLADPTATSSEVDGHEAACDACRAYARRARRAEVLIASALRFDVAKAKAGASASPSKRWVAVSAGLAAAVVAAVVLGLGQGFISPAEAITADIADHWHHEAYSWVVTNQQVDLPQLQKAIAGKVVLDHSKLPTISYVHSCFFRGEWVPHLVIQGAQGPVMVMLLPAEEIGKPMTIELVEENLEGIIMPHGHGSIVILGNQGEALEPLKQSLSRAVEWSI